MRAPKLCLSLWALAVALGVVSAEAAPGLDAKDVFELVMASDPQISPDGKSVVFVRGFADIRSDRHYSNLWRVSTDGSDLRPLTAGLFHDSSPRWSPDGSRLAFVSDRDGSSQVHVLWPESGTTSRLTQLETVPSGLTWSPDGRWLAFTAVVPGTEPKIVELPLPPKGAEWAPPARVIDRLIYRFDGVGYLPEGYAHVFVVPSNGGLPRQVSRGNFNHGPAGRAGGVPIWAGDGKSLLISANRRPDWDLFPLDNEIWELPLEGGEPKALTDRRGPDDSPALSPDGRYLAYVGFDDRFQGYQVQELYLLDLRTGSRKRLTADLDRDVEEPRWSAGGREIVFRYDDRGRTFLAAVTLEGKRRVVAEDLGGGISSYTRGGGFSLSGSGQIAFSRKTWEGPAEVATVSPEGELRVLTRLNEGLLAQRAVSRPEEIWLQSSHDSRPIQAWLLRPTEPAPEQGAPLILDIHGGPFSAYGPLFDIEKQVWAAKGYAVLYANPRGSASYGEEFGNLIHHAYPGDDFFDLDSTVDVALARGGLDRENVFVTGGSGGGVLTCWLVARSQRYRAAASAYPVINWVSWVLTSDLPSFGTKYWFPGLPWDHAEHYEKRSLLSVVGQVKTPTLVITGEADWRTPISESEQYYTALKLLGVESALVRVPEEPHGIRARPSHHISKMLHIVGWFDRYRQPRSEGAAR